MKITEKIMTSIKEYETIIIHRHLRPDPDALGSQKALQEIIQATFPEKKVYKVGGPLEGLEYLTSMDTIEDSQYEKALVIVTDTANAPRISDQRYKLGEKLIKIDHHPNDEPYGDLVWVNTRASSCSEIIYDFYDEFKKELKFTDEAARVLYAGIVGDTGRFLYPATTSHTLEVAADLMRYKFDAARMNRRLEQISTEVAHLSGYVLQNIQVDENGAAMVLLSQEVQAEFHIVDADTTMVVPLPGQIENIVAWAIFVAQPEGYYRVRLRSKGPAINGLAKRHDGGGHPLASGANAKDLTEVKDIYREIQELVAAYDPTIK